jgi:hypothetical protein
MCVLKERILLPPFRMIVPESFANVRPFQPSIDEDAIPMTCIDKDAVVVGGIIVRIPGRRVDDPDPPSVPQSGK